MALRHTYQTKGLPQRTHNSFALDSRALLYFIASFVSIYCFVWRPFFIVLLTIWHYWIHTSIGLFCRLLGRYVKPVWSSYPHCSFGHDCRAYGLDWVPLSCSLYGAWWALAYGPYGPPGPPHLVDSCQKQNPGYTFSSHFLWVESTHFTHRLQILNPNTQECLGPKSVRAKFWVLIVSILSTHGC